MKFAVFLFLFSAINLQCLIAEEIITPLVEAPTSKKDKFYPVTKREVAVNDPLIRELVIAKNHVTVSYKNTTQRSISPKYTLKIYNRYGFLIASKKVSSSLFGGSPRLEPGDVGGDKISIEWIDMETVFKFTNITLPKDFLQPCWISLPGKYSLFD